jgi:anti-sigma-K factor RskA
MNEDDDIDGLAAEYVLGSLDVDERKAVAARRSTDAKLNRAIEAWEKRLAPLAHRAPAIAPPPYVFRRIAGRLGASRRPSQSINPTGFSRQRAFAVGACGLAACLALAVVWLRDLPHIPLPRIPTTFVAQLQPSAAQAVLEDGANVWTPFRFEVSFDLRASTVVVSPVAAAPSSTRHYQLWLIPQDSGGLPISLGVIALPKTTTSPWLATYPPNDLLNTTLAVSLEPKNGSPIGMPSGPLVFVGKLSQAPHEAAPRF